jgi:hypothetical protein
MKEFKVFISHASDAENECHELKRIINQESVNHFKSRGYAFIPFCFKDIIPGSGSPQESIIDPEIMDKSCILMVFILKSKLGTIRNGQTGIEHEYELGKQYKKEIMIYDCNFFIRKSEVVPEQLQMVNDFFERVGKEDLYCRLEDTEEFKLRLRMDFSKWAENFIKDNETNFAKEMDDFSKLNRGF